MTRTGQIYNIIGQNRGDKQADGFACWIILSRTIYVNGYYFNQNIQIPAVWKWNYQYVLLVRSPGIHLAFDFPLLNSAFILITWFLLFIILLWNHSSQSKTYDITTQPPLTSSLKLDKIAMLENFVLPSAVLKRLWVTFKVASQRWPDYKLVEFNWYKIYFLRRFFLHYVNIYRILE